MALPKDDPAGRRALFASPNLKARATDGFHCLRKIGNHFAEMPSGGCEWVLKSAI